MESSDEHERAREIVNRDKGNAAFQKSRHQLAMYSAGVFFEAGHGLGALAVKVGGDQKDEALGVSLLLRIAGQLVSASASMFIEGQRYAAAALLRQIVEVEYLSWAFSVRDGDAKRWLLSNKMEREEFFRPAKLRKAAEGKFRGKDYGYHCELAGHPTPTGWVLLSDETWPAHLLLSDLLGHAGRIWDQFGEWAQSNKTYFPIWANHAQGMSSRFQNWKTNDPLCELPPP